MYKLHPTTFLLLLCGAACVSSTRHPHATVASDALLLDVSSTHQGYTAEARMNRAQAKDAHAAAVATTKQTRADQTRSEAERDAATSRVARAKGALEQARKTGTTNDVEQAAQELGRAEQHHQTQVSSVLLCEKQSLHASALEAVAVEHLAVAEAMVELAKVRAVNTLDRPDAQKPDPAPFEASLRTAEANEQVAQVRADATSKEIDVQRAQLPRGGQDGTR
jgi:hypothetical protein